MAKKTQSTPAKPAAKKSASKKPAAKKSAAKKPVKAAASEAESHPIDPRLLEILICPVSGDRLQYDREANELISKKARLAYAIRKGVPIMLPDEARQIS